MSDNPQWRFVCGLFDFFHRTRLQLPTPTSEEGRYMMGIGDRTPVSIFTCPPGDALGYDGGFELHFDNYTLRVVVRPAGSADDMLYAADCYEFRPTDRYGGREPLRRPLQSYSENELAQYVTGTLSLYEVRPATDHIMSALENFPSPLPPVPRRRTS